MSALTAWADLDKAVTAYMLGDVDGAAVARIQEEARRAALTVTPALLEVLQDHDGWRRVGPRDPSGITDLVQCICGAQYPTGDVDVHTAAMLAAADLVRDDSANAAVAEPTEEQVEGLARAWFTRDWEYDEPEEWDRMDAYIRDNYRTGARWLWQYVEKHRG